MLRKSKTVFQFLIGSMLFIWAAGLLSAEEATYDAGKRRDPFVSLTGEDSALTSASSSGIKLEGIVYDPNGRSMAILNEKGYLAVA